MSLKSKHLGYMLKGDWAITEEPEGDFRAVHLNGNELRHSDLDWLRENVMRASGYRRNEKRLWQKESKASMKKEAIEKYPGARYYDIAEDGADWKCSECDRHGKASSFFLIMTPNGERKVSCKPEAQVNEECIDPHWLARAEYKGKFDHMKDKREFPEHLGRFG